MDETDFFRGYARDVAVDPPVNGADNVQDALGASGSDVVLLSAATNTASQDTPTALTGDGSTSPVTCVTATPPAWMDNAGNITAPGLYHILTAVDATAGPTTPAQYIKVASPSTASEWVACDALGSDGESIPDTVIGLVTADLPFAVTSTITMPTDVTEAITASITVTRMASSNV